MTVPLTQEALFAARSGVLVPGLVMSIDGIPTKFGSFNVFEKIRIGDPGLFINNYLGDSWTIGGLKPILDQEDYIAFGGSGGGQTTTRIVQQVQIDKGAGTSVSQMTVTLIDKDEEISELISPGFLVPEILGRAVTIEFGFQTTAYPEDYIVLFKGYIEDIDSGPGNITLRLSDPEQRKRQQLFLQSTTVLNSNSTVVGGPSPVGPLVVQSSAPFYQEFNGPSGVPDADLEFYARVDDEFFRYDNFTGTAPAINLRYNGSSNIPKAQFGTAEALHEAGATASPLIRLTGNPLDIARKLMLSGWNGAYLTGIDVTHFNYIGPVTIVANSVFFFGMDLERQYGIYRGDYITTTGAGSGSNNVTLKTISDLVVTNDGTYLLIDGVTFANELNSPATVSFRSKWDTLPFGCKMSPNDIDLREWDTIYRLFLSSPTCDFLLEKNFEAKEFIESELLRPFAAYTIPRKGRISIGYHIGPIPGANIVTIDQTNVENANKIRLRRSLSKNYYNTIRYEYDVDRLEGNPITTKTYSNAPSVDDFNVGERAMLISSTGMRTSIGSEAVAQQASTRFLRRYKRAAEYFDNVETRFGDSFNLEIGDTILFDTSSLRVTDTDEGNRSGNVRFFQVINKQLDIARGKVALSLVDTAFDESARIGLIAPASLVQTGLSQTQFNIKSSFSSVFGSNEFLKWTRYLPGLSVTVRSPNGTTRNATRVVTSISGNTVTVASALGFTPQVNDLMELSSYDDSTGQVRLVYTYMRDTDPFSDGKPRFNML